MQTTAREKKKDTTAFDFIEAPSDYLSNGQINWIHKLHGRMQHSSKIAD